MINKLFLFEILRCISWRKISQIKKIANFLKSSRNLFFTLRKIAYDFSRIRYGCFKTWTLDESLPSFAHPQKSSLLFVMIIYFIFLTSLWSFMRKLFWLEQCQYSKLLFRFFLFTKEEERVFSKWTIQFQVKNNLKKSKYDKLFLLDYLYIGFIKKNSVLALKNSIG